MADRQPPRGRRVGDLPQVVAIEPAELRGHVDPPILTVFHPHPVRMLCRHDLHEPSRAAAGVPVGMPQTKRLAEPQARFREQREQQTVTQRPRPLPAGIPPRAALQHGCDLLRRQDRRRTRPGTRDPHHPRRPRRALRMRQYPHEPAPSRPRRRGPRHPHWMPGRLQIAVEGHHSGHPCRHRRRRRPTAGAHADRAHAGRSAAAQPADEPRQPGHPWIRPVDSNCLQIAEIARQRMRIRPDRVRRRADQPVMLEELLDRPDRQMVPPEHRPGTAPTR